MRMLVTGGAGFIGCNLALELESLGYEVDVLDNLFSGSTDNLKGFRGRVIIRDVNDDLSELPAYSAIFHQAAITDPRHPDEEEVYNSNVEGFKQLIEIATKNRSKLVYASSAGIYGNGPVPMVESQRPNVVTAYGRSKLEMERLAAERSDLHLVGLRYFNVFGPREAHKGRPASMIYHLWKSMRAGERPRLFEWGDQDRDFVYVKDVVRSNILALNSRPGTYNVGTGSRTNFNTLVETLNSVMGVRLDPEYIKMPYKYETYQHSTQANCELALRELNFRAQWDFRSAVVDYVKWLDLNAK